MLSVQPIFQRLFHAICFKSQREDQSSNDPGSHRMEDNRTQFWSFVYDPISKKKNVANVHPWFYLLHLGCTVDCWQWPNLKFDRSNPPWKTMKNNHLRLNIVVPIGSMYGIYAKIWDILMVNVTTYGIHKDPMGYSIPFKIGSNNFIQSYWDSKDHHQGKI